MPEKHLFIVDPVEEFDPRHDTTYVIMRAVEQNGGEIWCCSSGDLAFFGGDLQGTVEQISVRQSGEHEHFKRIQHSHLSVDNFDLVWMREDPPFDSQYLYSTYLLEEVSTPVLNSPRGIRDSNEKLFILRFPDLIPPTWVGANKKSARRFIQQCGGEAVAKSLSGYGGEEVYRVRRDEDKFDQVYRELSAGGEQSFMLQKFLPEVVEEGDRRLILLGGKPIGGLTRIPRSGDFRANLHSGGSAGDVYISDRERKICRRLKPELLRRGLYLVGLDLVGDKVTEINVTSPTCVQEINRAGEFKLEEEIVNYARRNLIE
ncbi:MAG: glutathione synthase [bacterium]